MSIINELIRFRDGIIKKLELSYISDTTTNRLDDPDFLKAQIDTINATLKYLHEKERLDDTSSS